MQQQKTYQGRQNNPHFFEIKGPHAPKWYIVDAKNQVVGRLATVLARVILGKHKVTFTRHADSGDFVVVINAEQVVFTRTKPQKKLYRHHTGYISGLKTVTAEEMLKKNPRKVLELAVWGMMNKTSLARHQIKKLKIYSGSEHPHKAQNPQPLPMSATRRTVTAVQPAVKTAVQAAVQATVQK